MRPSNTLHFGAVVIQKSIITVFSLTHKRDPQHTKETYQNTKETYPHTVFLCSSDFAVHNHFLLLPKPPYDVCPCVFLPVNMCVCVCVSLYQQRVPAAHAQAQAQAQIAGGRGGEGGGSKGARQQDGKTPTAHKTPTDQPKPSRTASWFGFGTKSP